MSRLRFIRPTFCSDRDVTEMPLSDRLCWHYLLFHCFRPPRNVGLHGEGEMGCLGFQERSVYLKKKEIK